MEDQERLDDLPESLQFHILSFLDTKQAIQTSVLSEPWLFIWTSMPVLHLHYSAFHKLYAFDKFVNNVLRYRDQSANLNTLTFTRCGVSSAKILKEVIDYAFSHGINHLELFIQHCRNGSWPVCLRTSCDSLRTLKLKSQSYVSCPFLSGSFKNLTVLHLKGTIVENLEPFSGFPMLEKLVLNDCVLGKILSVQALKLSDLTVSCHGCLDHCDFTTPNLRFFEYIGSNFPQLRTHDGLPVLETVVIDFHGVCYHVHEKRMFDDLISLFWALDNAKSLTLFSSIVDLLSLFPEKLEYSTSSKDKVKQERLDGLIYDLNMWVVTLFSYTNTTVVILV
ncbi:putative F-box/LRR-repeat protein At5g02930 [Cynara cardunculus var. scolymus]|uniref:putative F-box/LRR-repeat protein At5g02930 n=1 Tax=Cynara cardunculus var. scolymus TaxID=59895 RepID=UPI000D630642|nr:putative F-box/LRR-repeat protein At5g02930 [Cynara cardunculus var. scolymus]